jgi:hypothetical protein
MEVGSPCLLETDEPHGARSLHYARTFESCALSENSPHIGRIYPMQGTVKDLERCNRYAVDVYAARGWQGPFYWRLHGAPRTYYSAYDENWLQTFAKQLQLHEDVSLNNETWVIFDNTAPGHATANAVWMEDALR